MIEIALPDKYYGDVDVRELEKYQDFLKSHSIKSLTIDGKIVHYICSGNGEKTILTFSGGHSTPESAYETIMAFEDDYRVIVIDIGSFSSQDTLNRGVKQILAAERIDRVILTGQSMSGIIAQLFFSENFPMVEGLVLTNTLAPKKDRNKKYGLVIFNLFPGFILKPLIRKKLTKLADVDIEIPPEAEARVGFKIALIKDIIDNKFSKKIIINIIKLAFEFNESGYTRESFSEWPGRVLIITCEDDPYFQDVDSLASIFPNTEVFTFPKGLKHIAPMVHLEKFHSLIRNFLKKI